MKKIIICLAILFFCVNSFAETTYCVLKIEKDTDDLLQRYTVDVDYGDGNGFQSIYSDDEKKDWHFMSYVDVINKMARSGWKIVSVNDVMLKEFIITLKKEDKKEEEQ